MSADGQRVASAWSDGSIRYRDVADRGEPFTLDLPPGIGQGPPDVTGLALSADGLHLVVGTSMGTVLTWDLTDRQSPVREGTWELGVGIAAAATGQSPGTFAVALGDRSVRVWGWQGTSSSAPLILQAPASAKADDSITALSFSPDDSALATGTGKGDVFRWRKDQATPEEAGDPSVATELRRDRVARLRPDRFPYRGGPLRWPGPRLDQGPN